MKYLLVLQPLNKLRRDFYMPLGLAYVNGAMRSEGFDVEAINLQYVDGEPIEELKKTIIEREIDVVLCGGLTTQYAIMKEIFDAAREANPNVITVGGGGGFSSEPIVFSEMLNVDYAVIGEGEITNCELAYALDHGKSVDDILGLVIKKRDGYIYTGERPYIRDLDSIPFPSYEGLNLEEYLEEQRVDAWYHTYAFFSDKPRIAPMLLARSCPFSCSFCYHPIGRGYRIRSLDNFFEELDIVVEKYHINGFALIDECFSIKPDRVRQFCKRVKPYGLAWACQMRVESYSDDLIKTMVDAGCVSACFGVESMSQRVLDNMNKKTNVHQLQEALESSYRYKGGSAANIIFGAEAETVDTVRETMSWWEKNKKFCIANFGMVATYPGSAYYERAVQKGLIKDKKKFIEDECPLVNITQMTDKEYDILTAFARFKDMEVKNKGEVISVEETDEGINAVLECSHCGYRNDYRGIRKSAYHSGRLRNLACRNCHNYNDYVFDENAFQESWNTTEYLYSRFLGIKNAKVSDYMKKHNIQSAALYGLGLQLEVFAKLLNEELKEAEVEVAYGIDRQWDKVKGFDFPIFGLDDAWKKVDAVIVLPVYYFHEISKDLTKRTDMRVISVEEIFS